MGKIKVQELRNIKYQQREDVGYIRVLHAVPDAPEVDVYLNDNLLLRKLEFGEMTKYIPITQGDYKLSLYAAGDTTTPVIEAMLEVEKDKLITVAAIGMLKDISLVGIYDTSINDNDKDAMVRFIHFSPNAPAVDITLPDGTILFKDIAYKGITPYVGVPEGKYTLQVKPAGTNTVVLTIPNVDLAGGGIYSVFAIGLVGGTPPLQALIKADGITRTNY